LFSCFVRKSTYSSTFLGIKMLKLLFLELNHDIDWAVAAVGPAYIAANLKQYGHSTTLLQVPQDMNSSHLADSIKEVSPDIIGLSLTSRQWLRAKKLVPEIKKELDIPIIAGGLLPTFSSEEVLNTEGFDYVCIGEGEQAMLELVNAIENNAYPIKNIRNIRGRGEPMPELRLPFEPIDDIPFMARDMLGEQYGVRHISTQRGCPFPCTYCAAQQISHLYPGGYQSYGRRRSVDNVLQELLQIQNESELNYIVFLDDTFTINHKWVEEFCFKYKKAFSIPFSINARAETVNEKILAQLSGAGCMHIIYGVESGSEQLRQNVLQRNVSNEHLINTFSWTRNSGMIVTANYMLGIPGETRENVEETLSLHKFLKPDDFGYFVFYPFPGTAMFSLCKNKGYLPKDYYDIPVNHRESILNLPDLTKDDIKYYYQCFTELRIANKSEAMPHNLDKKTQQSISEQIQTFANQG